MTKEERDNKKLIHDYALEPELVANGDPFLFRYLTQYKKFSWDTGRIAVQYPSTWQRLVEKLVGDEKRLEVLLTWLPKKRVVRNASTWNDSFTWLENAEQENRLYPFHAILAHDNPRNQSNVVRMEDISSEPDNRAWDDPPPSVTVNRTATSMAACIEPLLRYSTRIRFIDPHFCAKHKRFQDPLCEFLRIICVSNRRVRLELHASANNASGWEDFRQECEEELPHIIPKGFTLTIRLWKNQNKGQKFHNRYILTDIGGVQFGTGLDQEITKGTQDQDIITRLSSLDSQIWLNKFSGPTPAFDLEGKIEIEVDLKGGVNIKSNP